MTNTTWTVNIEQGSDGYETVIIRRPVSDVQKGSDCMTRTFNSGMIVSAMVATIDDDFNVIKQEELFQYDKAMSDDEVCKDIMRKRPGSRVKILDKKNVDAKTVGIPRYVFEKIAVDVTRPESQKVSK